MDKLNLVIDKTKCINCGMCVNDCLTCALELDENKNPKVAQGGEKRCIKCQHCLTICPTGALSILNKKPENSELVNHSINSDEIANLIKSRRSFRHYKSENLPSETLLKIKNILNWVPTGCNAHSLHFSFVDNIDVMDDIRNYVNSKLTKILQKTPVKGILNKFSAYKDAILSGEDIIFRNAPHMLVVSVPTTAPCAPIDPIIALSYFELYAQSLGVGTLWCGYGEICMLAFPELSEKMEIPDGHKVSYVMLFGPASVKYARTIQPEPFSAVSVKKGEIKPLSFARKLKRYFWNLSR